MGKEARKETQVRLSEAELTAIRETMEQHVAPLGSSRLWLFGSRADPAKHGGDIDLYLEIDADVPNAPHLIRTLRLALFPQIGERRIDIVVRAQDTAPSALHDLAKLEGVLLWQHRMTFAGGT
jgi:hypothetical protein